MTDDALPVTRSGASDFRDGSGEEREYLYDSSGSLTADLNKGISLISYDYLGHPLTVQFTTGSRTDYVYTADGQRLRTVHTTAVDGIAVPLSQTLDLTPSQTLSKDSVDYAGGMVFLNGRPWLRPFSGGYISFDGDISADTVSVSFHYYTCDSQGNICAVVSEDGTVEQVTHYYPFGGTFADAGQNPFLQPYKYAGKELDRMHGLDWYDFGARIYDPVLVQWTSMDPLCEKYYHTSPYAYCGNDPVNAVDPDGRDWISAKYDGELFVYFDSRVSSQDDIRELYYGGGGHESISYVGKSGRITRNDKTLFSLSEDGSFYDASGNKVEKEYSIDGLLHVGSDKLGNDGKYSHNWYGTYLGPNNPTIAIDKHDDDKYSYSIPPIDRLDYAAFLHDKAYDLHNANGIIGAMINTSVVSADAALAFRSFKESLNQSCTSKEFLWSVATGSAFSMISMFKTYIKFRMFGLSFPFK